jgi:hypothetical protein
MIVVKHTNVDALSKNPIQGLSYNMKLGEEEDLKIIYCVRLKIWKLLDMQLMVIKENNKAFIIQEEQHQPFHMFCDQSSQHTMVW